MRLNDIQIEKTSSFVNVSTRSLPSLEIFPNIYRPITIHTTLYGSAAGCRSIQKRCAFWKHGLTSKNIQGHLTYFCKSNINQIFTSDGGMIWGVRIAIFTEIRHLVEELITFLSIFGPQKLGILTAWLNKSLSISTSTQWEGISVLKHAQSLHNYCENNSFWKTLWWDMWAMMHKSKVSWIGITVCGRACEQWCKVTWIGWIGIIVFCNRMEDMPNVVSYFQTDYTIVWFYHDVWYKHVFAEFWHRLGTDYIGWKHWA